MTGGLLGGSLESVQHGPASASSATDEREPDGVVLTLGMDVGKGHARKRSHPDAGLLEGRRGALLNRGFAGVLELSELGSGVVFMGLIGTTSVSGLLVERSRLAGPFGKGRPERRHALQAAFERPSARDRNPQHLCCRKPDVQPPVRFRTRRITRNGTDVPGIGRGNFGAGSHARRLGVDPPGGTRAISPLPWPSPAAGPSRCAWTIRQRCSPRWSIRSRGRPCSRRRRNRDRWGSLPRGGVRGEKVPGA